MSYLKGVYQELEDGNLLLLFSKGHSNYWRDNFRLDYSHPWDDERFEEDIVDGVVGGPVRFYLPEEFLE